MADAADSAAVLRDLAAARVGLADTVARMRQRNLIFAVTSVLTVVFLLGYLGYAAFRFGRDITPDVVAATLQKNLTDNLPDAQARLEKQLIDGAPGSVNDSFKQIEALPDQYAGRLQAQASARLDAAMPDVQAKMYDEMHGAVDQVIGRMKADAARTGQPLVGDEAQLQRTLNRIAEVYATETIRFVDQQHATYAADALAFTDYLERLATSPRLDHRDQLYREMFRTIFALVRDKAGPAGNDSSGLVLPMATKK